MLGEADVLLDPSQQWTTVDFLKNQVEFLLILEELNQLENVGMSLTMMECLNLTENASSSMAGYFIDNLNSTFYVGE